jgi:hypothetical protein
MNSLFAYTGRIYSTSLRLFLFWIVALMQGGLITAQAGTPPPAGIAPVNPPAGGFGIDGDLLANTPTPGVGDWLAGPGGAGGAVLDGAGKPINPLTTMHIIDPFGNSGADVIFAGGLKWFDNPANWHWTAGKPSSKTDINNVLFHITTDAEGHVWAMISADRLSTSGDSYIDFEFLQNTLSKETDGSFTSQGTQGGRTVNDLLLSLAFTGGGKVADFFVWSWQPDGQGGYAYVDVNGSRPDGRVFAALNSVEIPVTYGAFGQTSYAKNAFVEGVVDLTALLSNFDPCLSLLVKTIMVKTKASQSSTASIEDFIDPLQVTLTIGPSADAGPDQTRCMEGSSTAFSLQGKATQGLQPVAGTFWSVVEGTASIESTNSLNTTAHVSSARATLRLTVTQANGCIETDDVILTVAPLPDCSIAGPDGNLCPRSSVTFSAPAGMSAYAWAITGNGTITGSADKRTVTVATGEDCSAAFTLNLTVVSNNCVNTCVIERIVNDTNPPTISAPADQVLDCLADTSISATGMATADDDCGLVVSLTHNDSITSGPCAGSYVITRTWTALDLCSNAGQAKQTITVRDTHGPRIVRPADVTIDCSESTAPARTGQASATDDCSDVASLTYRDAIAPGKCAGSYVITRTWVAVDRCGNPSEAIQKITVQDTHGPIITRPANLTIDCSESTEPARTGAASATDDCSGVASLTHSDVTTAGRCAGSYVITRTWVAVDHCGNASEAKQTITVQDTHGPTITCPANVTIDCSESTEPARTGLASATDDCSGLASLTHTDSMTPGPCAGSYVITRTWTALDHCGNVSDVKQIITVRDTHGPTVARPTDVIVDCSASTDPAGTGTASATDDCSGVASLTHSDSIKAGNCAGNYVITRTWIATDHCGNVTRSPQKITVQDTTSPVIVCPGNLTLDCGSSTDPNETGRATATDNCSGVASISYRDAITPGNCRGNYVVTRTWTALDPCGNASTCQQIITVQDLRPPHVTCNVVCTFSQGGYGGGGTPGEILEANFISSFPNGMMVGIWDESNGDAPPNGFFWESNEAGLAALREFASGGGGTDEAFTRDYVNPGADLRQGGLARQTETLMLNIKFNELGIIGAGPNNFGSLIYTRAGDPLSGMTVSQILAVANRALAGLGLPQGYDFSSLTALIDRLNLSFHDCTPSDWATTYLETPSIVVSCPSEVPAPNRTWVKAWDDCGGPVTVTHGSDVITDQSCPSRYVMIRTWLAVDDCGNMNTCTQRIVVDDTTPPVLRGAPMRSVPAGQAWDFAEPTATDNCGGAVTLIVVSTVTNVAGDNVLVATRTWQGIDACGNTSSSFAQTVTVGDTTAVRSTFDINNEGWLVYNRTTSQEPIHFPTGGQLGGYVSTAYKGLGSSLFWAAPAQYLGDRAAFYNGVFTFALKQETLSTPDPVHHVILYGSGIWLVFDLPLVRDTNWITYTVRLNEQAGWMNELAQRPATQAEMIAVLANLAELMIWTDASASTSGGLDNVMLVPPSIPTASGWLLRLEWDSPGWLRLTWPTLASGYQLQVSDSLVTPNWRLVTDVPFVVNGLNRIVFKPTAQPKFYRLYKPAL